MELLYGSWKYNLLIFLIGTLAFIYLLVKWRYSYWERKGIKSIPNFNYLFGHLSQAFLQQEYIGETIEKVYRKTDEPFVGIYGVFCPILLVRDPELIQKILITDFSHFTDRGFHCNENYDPLSGNLLGLGGQRWRDVRNRLTPAFTCCKLKAMFSTFKDCGSILQRYLSKLAENNKLLDVCEVSACHFTNVIASVAFGIEVDTINNPNDDFRKYGRKALELSVKNALRILMYIIAPELMSILRVKCTNSGTENFIVSMVKQNLENRENFNICRKDFLQLLIQLRNTGNVQADDDWETAIKTNEKQKAMPLMEIAAQVGAFYGASVETSASALWFVMHELAVNPEIQHAVYNEIDQVLNKHNAEITYESILEMKYLEACIDETLRKYSIVPIAFRTCVKDYRIPRTDKIIEKGTRILIPIVAIHRDAKFYENPDKFDPNRFNKQNLIAADQINRPYYAFGDGPRNCIGLRMGKIQTKITLVMMLQKFYFEYEDKLINRHMKFDPRKVMPAPNGGMHLLVRKR